jgi:signal peptidase II
MRILWIAALAVFVDQLTKIVVLQNMYRGQSIPLIGDWLKFTFTENPGMAFGISFGPRGMVTIFSILATLLILFYIYRVRHGYAPYVASLALILGGALGNIIDRVFYGLFLGYGPLFAGKVVDFIHVDLWRGFIPSGVPFFGESYVALFPIWNVADMSIVAGVVGILVFQHRFHEQLAIRAGSEEDRVNEVPISPAPAAPVVEKDGHARESLIAPASDSDISSKSSSSEA